MLGAMAQLAGPRPANGVSHDRHVTAGHDLVVPAIDDRADGDRRAEFLGELADETVAGILARLRPAARQLPLAALVFEQHHPAVLDEHALDRNRRRHRRIIDRLARSNQSWLE